MRVLILFIALLAANSFAGQTTVTIDTEEVVNITIKLEYVVESKTSDFIVVKKSGKNQTSKDKVSDSFLFKGVSFSLNKKAEEYNLSDIISVDSSGKHEHLCRSAFKNIGGKVKKEALESNLSVKVNPLNTPWLPNNLKSGRSNGILGDVVFQNILLEEIEDRKLANKHCDGSFSGDNCEPALITKQCEEVFENLSQAHGSLESYLKNNSVYILGKTLTSDSINFNGKEVAIESFPFGFYLSEILDMKYKGHDGGGVIYFRAKVNTGTGE